MARRILEGAKEEMKSLELFVELNKILIEADKRADILFRDVGEFDKQKCDLEHDILNEYQDMSAKDKRQKIDEFYNLLSERRTRKDEQKEAQILKDFYNVQGMKNALNNAINELRKFEKSIETPLYHKRAKANKGEVVVVKKETKTNE